MINRTWRRATWLALVGTASTHCAQQVSTDPTAAGQGNAAGRSVVSTTSNVSANQASGGAESGGAPTAGETTGSSGNANTALPSPTLNGGAQNGGAIALGGSPSTLPSNAGAGGASIPSEVLGTGGFAGTTNIASGGTGEQGGSDGGAGGSFLIEGTAGAPQSGLAGASAAGGAGGASAEPQICPGAELCDDFESYAVDTAPNGIWDVSTDGGGTATVDATHAFSGTQSVHFNGIVTRDNVYMLAQGEPIFPVQTDALFVRFMMYIENYPNGSPMHTRLVWVGAPEARRNVDGTGYAMETYNGIAIERIGSGRFRDTSQRMTDDEKRNKWICWEFEINNADGPPPGSSGSVLPRLWRDDDPLSLAIAGSAETWNPVPFEMLQFSLFAYQDDTVLADFWIDDIVMSTERINCPTGTTGH